MKASGAKADFEITAQDPTPIFNAMNDTGFKPEWALFGQTFYSPKSVQAAKAVAVLPEQLHQLRQPSLRAGRPVPGRRSRRRTSWPPRPARRTSTTFNPLRLQRLDAVGTVSDRLRHQPDPGLRAAEGGFAHGLDRRRPVRSGEHQPERQGPHQLRPSHAADQDTAGSTTRRSRNPNSSVYNCGADNLITTKSFETS